MSIANTRLMVFFVFCMIGVARGYIFAEQLEAAAKIQAAYWMVKPAKQARSQLRLLKEHGLNTALLKDSRYVIQEQLLQRWGESARREDIRFLPVFNFSGKNESKRLQGTFSSYHDRYGIRFPATPCPLDRNYWERSVGRRLEQIAQLAKQEPGISGAVFDSEMYGSEIRVYRDTCFCDLCWQHFIQNTTQQIPELPPDRRFNYLSQHHLVERYFQVQEMRLQKIISEIRHDVHAIAPRFSLGFLAFKMNWFYRGLIRGLGSSMNPVNVFSENSYVFGFTPHIEREKAFIHEIFQKEQPSKTLMQEPHARYIPGIWLGRFFPEELTPQLVTLNRQTDGYWIYSADSLWEEGDKQDPLTLHGTIYQYWEALKQGSEAHTHMASEAPELSPPNVFQASFYDKSRKYLYQAPSLESFLTSDALHKFLQNRTWLENDPQNIKIRGKILIHGLVREGGRIAIKYIALRGKEGHISYSIFNYDGEMAKAGLLDKQNPSIYLSLTELSSERFSLLIDSGHHSTEIVCADLPFIIEASTSFPLQLFKTAYRFGVYLPSNSEWVYLRAYSSGNEPALLTLHSPEKLFHKQVKLAGFTELKIPRYHPQESEAREFWGSLSIEPLPSELFEDVQLYFMNAEYPYLIP